MRAKWERTKPNRPASTVFVVVIGLILAMVLAACGSDSTKSSENTNGSTTSAAKSKGKIGYVVAGDKADGGFYQGQVDAVEATAKKLGYSVIVTDKVNPGAAQEAFENLARQNLDLIIAGGAELTDGLIPVSKMEQYKNTKFVIVTNAPPTGDSYATVGANEAEAHYMGGVAAALLLKRTDKNTACIVAGPELDFVKSAAASMTAGLKAEGPGDKMLVTYTGDFEDAGLAQEAANAQIKNGCQVIYPYLGGALTAVVKAGNDAGIDVSSTSVDRCKDPTAKFAMGILYNPSLFLGKFLQGFAAGKVVPGKQFAVYGVGSGTGVGAVICDATPEEQKVLDETRAKIDDGTINVEQLIGNAG